MKIFLLISLFFLTGIYVSAQVKDTTKDTLKTPKRSFESSLFSNDDTLTRNDYLLNISKVFQTLNKASAIANPLPSIDAINLRIDEDDSAISIIRDRITTNERILNLRNLQMYNILLDQINKDTKDFSVLLNQYDSILDETKKGIFDLRKDTVIRHIFRDSVLRASFKPQLTQLRTKWKYADSLIKKVNVLIDNTLARASDNLIETDELQLKVQSLIATTGSRAFSKERNYLWESRKPKSNRSFSAGFKKTVDSERKITKYYFSHTHNQLLMLLVCGLVFFFWIFFNFKSLKKRNKLDAIQPFKFRYINSIPIFASLVFMLSLAPLFDLNAPFVYVETIEFFLMIVLTVSFWKLLPRKLFYLWIIFIVLFLSQSFLRYTGLPFYLNRWVSLIIHSASFLLGGFALLKFRKEFHLYKALALTTVLYSLFNFLAVICNLFGRVTLMQIFSSTGTYALIQTVALIIFIHSVTNAFLLQIQASRVRKEYSGSFEFDKIKKGVLRIVFLFAVVIWLIVFATNLNIYGTISDKTSAFLSSPRIIGNFTFTFSGIILFLAIMWIANFLQKYIAYFFGDVDDDVSFNNKSQRSKLMVTRLVLLVAGFLLAVAASGLAIDRITVILGALSVGIGLGLQSIVNNFVSGIILIFDRTLRIGDTVEIGDKKGRVKEISMRSSTLLTSEGAEVIIPNGDILSHNFVNWSLSNNYRRADLSFTLDQLSISEETRLEIVKIIKSSPDVLQLKNPEVFINALTSVSTQLKIYFWCNDVTKTEQARSEVYAGIYSYLQGKGIKIL